MEQFVNDRINGMWYVHCAYACRTPVVSVLCLIVGHFIDEFH